MLAQVIRRMIYQLDSTFDADPNEMYTRIAVRLSTHGAGVPEAHHGAVPVHAGRGRAGGQAGAGVR